MARMFYSSRASENLNGKFLVLDILSLFKGMNLYLVGFQDGFDNLRDPFLILITILFTLYFLVSNSINKLITITLTNLFH